MSDFAKSIIRFSWGLSLFGVKQLANLLTPQNPSQPTDKVTKAIDSVTLATEEQLGNALKGVFKTGNQLQKGMVDMASRFPIPDGVTPSRWMQMASDMMNQTVGSESCTRASHSPGAQTGSESETPATHGEDIGAGILTGDIVDTAIDTGLFNELFTVVRVAGLVEALKADGPFTVFAPIDEAFYKLPEGTLEELVKLKNKIKLQKILIDHIIPGMLMADDVVKQESVKTVTGQTLTISVKNSEIMVDNAKIVETDIVCTNGVIHAIDSLLMPKDK